MIATKPANEDESEAKLRWAFRMYDTDSSGEYLTMMNALLMLHNVLIYLTIYIHIFSIYFLMIISLFLPHFLEILILGCIDEKEFSEIISSMYEEQGVSCVSCRPCLFQKPYEFIF